MPVTYPRPQTRRPAARPVARPAMPRRRKPAPPSKGQMVLGALAKALPTGTTDVKKKRRGAASPSHKGRNGLMLLAAGAAAAAARKRRGQRDEPEVVVAEPVVTPATNATAPPVTPRA